MEAEPSTSLNKGKNLNSQAEEKNWGVKSEEKKGKYRIRRK